MKPEQFWELVDKTSSQPHWIWRGTRDKRGYGRISMRLDGVRIQLAHRAAYILLRGVHPDDLHHKCQIESCVNPECLDPIGRAANARIQRWPERDKAGHTFDSFYTNRKGYRIRKCSVCARESQRKHNAKPEVKAYKLEWERNKYRRLKAAA